MPAWRRTIDDYGDPVQLSGSSSVPITAAAAGQAWFDGLHAQGVIEVTDDPAALDGGGWWAVLITFEGESRFWRFAQVERAGLPAGKSWRGPAPAAWRSSLDQMQYQAGVSEIRRRIHDGEVYQVNLCRVLSAQRPQPDREEAGETDSPWGLASRLAAGNPAPYGGVIDVPELNGVTGARLVCASPELFLERAGDRVRSGPIKGTGATEADLLPKDEAENVMIVDLVRNDLQRVSGAGTVEVHGVPAAAVPRRGSRG